MTIQEKLFPTEQLDSGSTNFVSNMKLPIHRWFRYSAGFSAQWAEDVIRKEIQRTSSDIRVLDPFVGSGTTLLAAQEAGVASTGVESHPFVAEVARAKLAWSVDPARLLKLGAQIIRVAEATQRPDTFEREPRLLQKCYSPDALADLRLLQEAALDTQAEAPYDRLLWLALVASLRPTSHVGTAQWQYVLPNKRKASAVRPFDAFGQNIAIMATDLQDRSAQIRHPPETVLIEEDIRSVDLPENQFDLAVTSPPYANNYDYADATRLEMTFLGDIQSWGDLKKVRKTLVHSCSQHMPGYDAESSLESPLLAPIIDELTPTYEALADIRLEKGGRKAYHSMIVAYFHDMAQSWQTLRNAVRPGGALCYIIGDSAPYGIHVPVEKWLGDLAQAAGFAEYRFEKVRDRNTKWKNRKHRVPLHEGRLWIAA